MFAKRLALACLFATAFATYEPKAYSYTSTTDCAGTSTEVDFATNSKLIGTETMTCSSTGQASTEGVSGFVNSCSQVFAAGTSVCSCPSSNSECTISSCIGLLCVDSGAGASDPSPPPSPPPPGDSGGGTSGASSSTTTTTTTTGTEESTTTTGSNDKPCFGRDTTHAERPDGERVLMSTLKAGDLVKDGPSTVARVIVNQHANEDHMSRLLELEHSGGTLHLTPDHVLLVDGKFAAARAAVPGSTLGEHTVMRVTSSTGKIINPLTTSGKILANGVVASTYPEWIAEYMLESRVFPLPLSLSNVLSYLFPESAQAYYNTLVEPFVTEHHPSKLKAALSAPLIPVAFVIGDFLVSAGFVAFSLASPVAIIALAVGVAKAARK